VSKRKRPVVPFPKNKAADAPDDEVSSSLLLRIGSQKIRFDFKTTITDVTGDPVAEVIPIRERPPKQ
jgi:hypothetical protein